MKNAPWQRQHTGTRCTARTKTPGARLIINATLERCGALGFSVCATPPCYTFRAGGDALLTENHRSRWRLPQDVCVARIVLCYVAKPHATAAPG